MELGSYMQTGRNNRKDERRSGSDRRIVAIGLDFPFIDGHGHLVTEERRKSNRRKTGSVGNTPGIQKQKNYA